MIMYSLNTIFWMLKIAQYLFQNIETEYFETCRIIHEVVPVIQVIYFH